MTGALQFLWLPGWILSAFIARQPALCILAGFALTGISLASSWRLPNQSIDADPYKLKAVADVGWAPLLILAVLLAGMGIFMVTRLLPLPPVILKSAFRTGGFYFFLGGIPAMCIHLCAMAASKWKVARP